MQDSMLSIAKSLKDGNTDEAIETIEKTVENLKATSEEVQEEVKKEAEEPEVVEDKGEDAPEEGGEEAVEKVTLEVTKTQAEALTKFADMYISGDNIGKLLAALANSGVDVEQIFKTVQSHSETLEKMSKGQSKQIVNKTADQEDGVWWSLDLM